MGHGPGRPVKTCGRPHGHGGRRSSRSSCTPHLMGSGPGRPVKTHGPPHGPGGAAHIEPTSHGPRPGPARPIIFSEDGPRPSLVHQNFRGWAAARPSPSHFQIFTARPGPDHQLFKSLGPAQLGPSQFQKCPPGPARPITIFRSARPGPDKRPMTSLDIFYFLPIFILSWLSSIRHYL